MVPTGEGDGAASIRPRHPAPNGYHPDMSAPTAARATLSEIEATVRASSPPPEWIEDHLTWLRVLQQSLPEQSAADRSRVDALIARLEQALAGHRAAQETVSWSAPGPGAQLM